MLKISIKHTTFMSSNVLHSREEKLGFVFTERAGIEPVIIELIGAQLLHCLPSLQSCARKYL